MRHVSEWEGWGDYLNEPCLLSLWEAQGLYLQYALAKRGLRIDIGSRRGGS